MSRQQITMGYGLSALGVLFFVLGLGQLLMSAAADSHLVGSYLIQLAGWFVVSGGLVQFAEAGSWPFRLDRSAQYLIKDIVSEVGIPLALLLLLFLSILLLVGLMLTPFLLFIFQRLF